MTNHPFAAAISALPDLLYPAAAVAFFALCAGYAYFCRRVR